MDVFLTLRAGVPSAAQRGPSDVHSMNMTENGEPFPKHFTACPAELLGMRALVPRGHFTERPRGQ